MRIALDIETRDPDDALTLALLATHPLVQLAVVTVNPGTPQQLGVARHILNRLGRRDVPIGARHPASLQEAVSPFHYAWLGAPGNASSDGIAHELLAAELRADPLLVLISGGPLHNLRLLLSQHPDVMISRWVAQGGFAGDNVVPPAQRLPKFAGVTMCESFNFGGDKKGTLMALDTPRIRRRELVAKNVTHGVAWDAAFHARVRETRDLAPGVQLMAEGMEVYLRDHRDGKLLHDPLTACAAIDPGIVTWREVRVMYRDGKWGSEQAHDTGTFISIAVDHERFFTTLVASRPMPVRV